VLQKHPSGMGQPTLSSAVQYGAACRFDHPLEYAVKLNKKGLPIRPGEPVCGFYAKKGECRYGASPLHVPAVCLRKAEHADSFTHDATPSAGPSCKFSHPDAT